jgi:hypothetical protein
MLQVLQMSVVGSLTTILQGAMTTGRQEEFNAECWLMSAYRSVREGPYSLCSIVLTNLNSYLAAMRLVIQSAKPALRKVTRLSPSCAKVAHLSLSQMFYFSFPFLVRRFAIAMTIYSFGNRLAWGFIRKSTDAARRNSEHARPAAEG